LSQKTKRRVFQHIQQHFFRYLVLIFLFFTGALCGVFSVSTLTESGRASSVAYSGALMQALSRSIPDIGLTLLWSVLIRFGSLLILYGGGILCVGTFASTLHMLCFGFSVGFTVDLLFQSIGWKAAFVLLGALFPAAFIFIVYLYASNMSMQTSRSLRQEIRKRRRLSLRERAARASSSWAPVSAAMLAGVLLESLLSPLLSHYFRMIFV